MSAARYAVVFLVLAGCVSVAHGAELVWARQIAGTGPDSATAVTIDSNGDLYVVGGFSDTVDFDPSASIVNLTSAGAQDAYVWKLNSSGDLVWVLQLGASGPDIALGITIDGSDLYVVGSFSGTVDVDPSPAVQTLTSAGGDDAFVWKLTSAGALVWARSAGGADVDQARAVAVDPGDDVFVGGTFSLTADFDPPSATLTATSAGLRDAFVWKLTAAGNPVWVRRGGGTAGDLVEAVSVDGPDVIAVGNFVGTADFDPSASLLTAVGNADGFAWKLDDTGALGWLAHAATGPGNQHCNDVLVYQGRVHVAGWFRNLTDFDPSAAVANLFSAGNRDFFLSRLDSTTGAFINVLGMGSTTQDAANAIAVESSLNQFGIVGPFTGTMDFDPGPGVFTLTSVGGEDAYMLRIDANDNFLDAAHADNPAPGSGPPVVPLNGDEALDVALDGVFTYAVGRFRQTADFDPSVQSLPVTSLGSSDGFVWKLSPTPVIERSSGFCFTGTSTGADYSWLIDIDPINGAEDPGEPVDSLVTNTVPPSATGFSTDFIASINGNAQSAAWMCHAAPLPQDCFWVACGGRCSITTTTACLVDSDCPISETCLTILPPWEFYVGPPGVPATCHVTNAGCAFNPTIIEQTGCTMDLDCEDGLPCTIDTCRSGLCDGVTTGDTDSDAICDAIDVCPNDADSMQEDVDSDGFGDACDTCLGAPNPGQQPATFGLDITAVDKTTFSWGVPRDAEYVRGDVLLVASYVTDPSVPLVQAAQFTDGDPVTPGGGFFYLVRDDCVAASWQTAFGSEPGRDGAIP